MLTGSVDMWARPPSSDQWSVVTCCADGLAHAVPDATLAGVATGQGRMLSVCGRLIVPGALTSPLGPPCPLCPGGADAGTTSRSRVPAPRRSRRWW